MISTILQSKELSRLGQEDEPSPNPPDLPDEKGTDVETSALNIHCCIHCIHCDSAIGCLCFFFQFPSAILISCPRLVGEKKVEIESMKETGAVWIYLIFIDFQITQWFHILTLLSWFRSRFSWASPVQTLKDAQTRLSRQCRCSQKLGSLTMKS